MNFPRVEHEADSWGSLLASADRTARLLGGCGPEARILELGPSHNPVAPKAAGWRSFVVDYTSRDGLIAKFAGDPTVDTSRIEEVDAVWNGGALHDAVPRPLHGSFDRLIASHVIEHLPDLAGFLRSAERLLKPDGVLALAIPDRRYCFDYFKPPSLTGDVLEAFHLGRTRHSARTAWNHVAYSVFADGTAAWGQHGISGWSFMDGLERAAQAAVRAAAGDGAYEDFHAWHFTPAAFALVILELGQIGIADWRIAELHASEGCEFIAILARGAQRIAAEGEVQAARLQLLRRMLEETGDQLRYAPGGRNTAPVPPAPAPPRHWVFAVAAAAVGLRERVRAERESIAKVRRSGFFDRAFYLSQCADDRAARRRPELHYLSVGAAQGLDPGPNFRTGWYLSAYPDVAAAEVNPLLHYAELGKIEGRLPISLAEWLGRYGRGSGRTPPANGSLISIVMPVCDPPPRYLREALQSVMAQTYPGWELCVADDASGAETQAVLSEYASDPRVRVTRLAERGGIAKASNAALALARGEYVALMDHDDTLPPHALAEIALVLAEDDQLELVFTDEVVVDAEGVPVGAYFKPGLDLDLLLGHNLVSHLGVYRARAVREIGGFRAGLDGGQDYDLALRMIRISGARRVRHLAQPLYHWRRLPGSFSRSRAERCAEASRRAVMSFIEPESPGVGILPAPHVAAQNRVVFPLPDPEPAVTVVAHDADVPLGDCGLRNVAIVRPEPAELRDARGGVLVFLGRGFAPVSSGWLRELVAQALRPDVGAVGAKLLAGNRVAHGGFRLDPERVALDLHAGVPAASVGYHGHLALQREVAAVRCGCLATRREVFDRLGGFDAGFGAFQDVDYCLRARSAGLRVVWTPFSVLQGPGPGSGPEAAPPRSVLRRIRQRWAAELAADPFDNPNLLESGTGVAVPPRRR